MDSAAPIDGSALIWNETGATWTASTTAFAPKYPVVNAQTDTTYIAVLGDDQKFITCDNADPVTFTVPAEADVAFPIGASMTVYQVGAGRVTFAGDTGVTVETRGGAYSISAQYGVATLFKRAADTWALMGDLSV